MQQNLQQRRLYFLTKKFKQTQKQFELIQENDKIGIGVSGGKDSITLALLLQYYQRIVPFKFEFFPIHLQWDFQIEKEQKQQVLKDFFQQQSLDLQCISTNYDQTPRHQAVSPCFSCAWNRRKALFQYCYEHGYNKLALGHHLDDAAETSLMNLFFHGNLETMMPKVKFFDGKIELIRPLILTPEKEVIQFSKTLDFKFYGCSCPSHDPSQRDHAGQILESFGHLATNVKHNIWHASMLWQQQNLNNNKQC